MNEDIALLRALIAAPHDTATRLVYADWLEERDDPRAPFLRSNWTLPRLSFVDWVVQRSTLEFYLHTFPELHQQLPELDANAWWRNRQATFASAMDSLWLATIDTLGRPFRPFYFWNNTGPKSFQEGELPFIEPIGTRGPLVTFESAFNGESAWSPGLAEDLHFVSQLELGDCISGAASCPVHPFVCELRDRRRRLTGAMILRALKVRDFRSVHISSLDVTSIAYPGYAPCTPNDEIHNDPAAQYLFALPTETTAPDVTETVQKSARVHAALQAAVVDRQLWYVLLHSREPLFSVEMDDEEEDDLKGPWVVLFAVGRSLRGNRLIGGVSHQSCHNFCD